MVNESKKIVIQKFKELISEYNIVAAVNLYGLAAKQLQAMREDLRGTCELFMGKHRLMRIALKEMENEKPGLGNLADNLEGMPALLFTNDNPFKLYKFLEKSKTPVAAKAGQTVPKDVIVPAGPTSFAPGPIIGELKGAGIKAGIVAGKIEIQADSKVLSKGDVVSETLAPLLARLDVKPMEIGLNLVAAYENGLVFEGSTLAIDETKFMADLSQCASWALNLSVEMVYPTKENINIILDKAIKGSRNLAINEGIINKDLASEILVKAIAGANGLQAELQN